MGVGIQLYEPTSPIKALALLVTVDEPGSNASLIFYYLPTTVRIS